MIRRRFPPVVLAVVVVAAAAVAAVALNVLLLGRASAGSDPVGRLVPRAHLPAAPHWTVRPASSRHERDGSDD